MEDKKIVKGFIKSLPEELLGDFTLEVLHKEIELVEWKEGNDTKYTVNEGSYKGIVIPQEYVSKPLRGLLDEFQDILLTKAYNGEELDEDELAEIFYEYDDICVETDNGGNRRWSAYEVKTLFVYGKYIDVSGDIALTESGEDSFFDQPIILNIKPIVKNVKALRWETLK